METKTQETDQSPSLKRMVRRYGPWICKQRPAGDWVVDQLDRETMRVRRYGPYPTETEAGEVFAGLAERKSWPTARLKERTE